MFLAREFKLFTFYWFRLVFLFCIFTPRFNFGDATKYWKSNTVITRKSFILLILPQNQRKKDWRECEAAVECFACNILCARNSNQSERFSFQKSLWCTEPKAKSQDGTRERIGLPKLFPGKLSAEFSPTLLQMTSSLSMK